MYNKKLIEKVCNLNCSEKDVNIKQTSIRYDTRYPFKKYLNFDTIVSAIQKYIDKEWNDRTLASWFCIYNWILCGGFSRFLKEDLNKLEDLLKEIITCNFDGMAFFEDSIIEDEGIEYLDRQIELYKNLEYLWNIRKELECYFSCVGKYAKINEEQFVVFINRRTKEYMIVHTDYLDNGYSDEMIKYIEDSDFIKLINDLNEEGYKVISYNEEWYYDDVEWYKEDGESIEFF